MSKHEVKAVTLDSYRSRVLSVVDYIWQHCEGDLNVNLLAEVAHFSPYHFHRIYREMMHENVNVTVRRLRMHRAAAMLIRGENSLSQVAKSSGYTSVEAFSRAFTKAYDESPSNFRNKSRQRCIPWQAAHSPLPKTRSYPMHYEVEIKEIDSIALAGTCHTGDYNDIGATFEKLFMKAAAKGLVTQNVRSFGIYYDDPASVDKTKLRAHACLSASNQATKSADLEPLSVGGGKHAILDYIGPYAGLEQAYEWLYGQWLPNSEYDAADAPPFEEYLNDHKTVPATELKTLIYLPLAS